MGDYHCWGDDKEDLIEQVRAKVRAEASATMRDTIGRDSNRWRVTGIKCSKGHVNSFAGYGEP